MPETSSSLLEASLDAELQELAAVGLRRQRRTLDSPCGRIATVDGRELLNFASNDYLGLPVTPDWPAPPPTAH